MTFGEIKTYIESKLVESYIQQQTFKTTLKEFKNTFLKDNNISKLFSLYNDLSTPQGLSEKDAMEYLNEGIELIRKVLSDTKLPNLKISESTNNYRSIDELVYVTNKTIQLSERLNNKKSIISILTQPKKQIKESVNIPISSMVKIANQTLNGYVKNLTESDKKSLFELLKEDTGSLETKFVLLKEEAHTKLKELVEKEENSELKGKINETINKIDSEKFDQISYFKLKKFVETL